MWEKVRHFIHLKYRVAMCRPCAAVKLRNFVFCEESISLRAGRSGDRIPVGAGFSEPFQTDPGAHQPSCTIDHGSISSRGVKRTWRGVDHHTPPHPNLAPRLKKE